MDAAMDPARPTSPEASLPWIPALDGLRAVAVLGVILFHTKAKSVFVGGFLGVDLFFVLSGFLITTLLAREWQASARVSLAAFYRRRARRLLPAAACFLVVFLLYLAVVNELIRPAPLRLTGVSIGWIAGYAFNWRMAFELPVPSSFGHLWSLSVEEQYYLLWPAVLILMLRARISSQVMFSVTVALAAASAAVPFLLPGSSWDRLYYGTDFRAHELLIGSAAGQLYAAGVLAPSLVRGRPFQVAVAASAIFLVVRLFAGGNDKAPWMFTGGLTLSALAAAVIVVACACAEGRGASALLASRPMTYVGQRSYALYLWHLPFAHGLSSLSVVPQLALTVALSLLFAELSYRLVERRGLSRQRGAQGMVIEAAPPDRGGKAAPALAA